MQTPTLLINCLLFCNDFILFILLSNLIILNSTLGLGLKCCKMYQIEEYKL